MFKKVLIIDNDKRFVHTLTRSIQDSLQTAITTTDFKLTDILLFDYELYIVRLDTKSDEIIKELVAAKKLVIIITNNDSKEARDRILAYHATDYIVVNSPSSIEFICKIVHRLSENKDKFILIVDDSKMIQNQIESLLTMQNLDSIIFNNGQEAWEYLSNPKSRAVNLVVSDYEMPVMNGYELVKNIRTQHSLEELPVLILSGTEDTYMISRFLKAGANDYIPKPFINEEFLARTFNALSVAGMFQKIKSMAMNDQLTGLNNRAFFYESGVKILDIARRSQQPVAIAMIDIDNFKSINDTYGHEVGDQALIHVAHTMRDALRKSDLLVRFGGEEFVILLPNCPHNEAVKLMQKVCDKVANSPLKISEETTLNITVSIGVTSIVAEVDSMIEKADKYMYVAKKSGKNRVYSEE